MTQMLQVYGLDLIPSPDGHRFAVSYNRAGELVIHDSTTLENTGNIQPDVSIANTKTTKYFDRHEVNLSTGGARDIHLKHQHLQFYCASAFPSS